jgi:hypothetical protein
MTLSANPFFKLRMKEISVKVRTKGSPCTKKQLIQFIRNIATAHF